MTADSSWDAPNPVSLDEIDKAIIGELQRDGRVSYAELGPRVGLSAAAARQRVQRLIDSGTVQVVGVTDPIALGYPVIGMLGVSVDGDVKAVADAVAAIDGVIYVVYTSGRFDLAVEVIATEASALLDVVNDRVRTIRGVRNVECNVCFGIHTHRFGWMAR